MTSYEVKLDRLLDRIFGAADDQRLNLVKLANLTGLAYPTVWRIDSWITRLPRLKTIMLLADAVGLNVDLVAKASQRRQTA